MRALLAVFLWIARISSLVIAGAFLLLFFGEWLTPHSGGPSGFLEWGGIVLMFVACLAPLAAWRWEIGGAIISLASLGAIAWVIRGSHTFHVSISLMAIPGFLFFLHWIAQREIRPTHRAI